MKRKSYCGGTHEEALDRLCFVCGEIVKDNRSYTVEKNLDLLGKALNCPEIFTIPDVTPTYICKKCHLTLSKVNRGETVITGRKLMDIFLNTGKVTTQVVALGSGQKTLFSSRQQACQCLGILTILIN